ncbi:MAG TPA: amidohydrolase family protein [Gemmatimonadaceae bacterium]|nr:amidohydrolase family protein [Gemmatimonadaceae bacterium]
MITNRVTRQRCFVGVLALVFVVNVAESQPARGGRPALATAVRAFVQIDTPTVALTHVRVIDGTGAPARPDQTIVIRDGQIAAIGTGASVQVPAGTQVLDLTGKSVIPGLVMVHEHLYYPTGPGVYAYLAESFTRLYLAGGVTSMRTGGNMNGFGELNIKRSIDRGERAGPWIDATAPYLEGAGLGLMQVHELTDAADARRLVDYWSDMGATSLKAYMHITRDELRAAIDEGHKRGLKTTGHLCSVTYREAAQLGIDNLEHGFFASTDFVADKQPDVCPGQGGGQAALAAVDPNGEAVKSLIRDLVQHHVALTSTLTVFETFTPGRPMPPGVDVLDPLLRQQFEQRFATTAANTKSPYTALFAKGRQMEVDFFRAGGLLLAGTDPTGGGGVIPGYSDQRAIELLAESGLTPLEAIKVGTLNGATYLGRAARVGSIASGKQADLVVIDGDPSARIEDIRKVSLVFKEGVGYDPAKLIASVRGKVGLF